MKRDNKSVYLRVAFITKTVSCGEYEENSGNIITGLGNPFLYYATIRQLWPPCNGAEKGLLQ